MPTQRRRPTHAALHDAEVSLLTLDAHIGVLRGRLVVARLSGRRTQFEPITDTDLALVVAQCEAAIAVLGATLGRMAPELAATAVAIADANHQREFTNPRPPVAAHLRLVQGDRGA